MTNSNKTHNSIRGNFFVKQHSSHLKCVFNFKTAKNNLIDFDTYKAAINSLYTLKTASIKVCPFVNLWHIL
jgi:hypothetical protein